LRLVEARDAPALFALTDANRARLRTWLPWVDATRSVEDGAGFIDAQQRAHAATGAGAMGLWIAGALAGVAGFNTIDRANRAATIGYWLGAAHEGRGWMTRAVAALTDHALTAAGLNRVVIACAVGNRRSRAIPERLGFAHEGVHREAEWLYDHFVDHDMFAMLARDWARR
jgi:ribosomal-protein-serine acetyltransferase